MKQSKLKSIIALALVFILCLGIGFSSPQTFSSLNNENGGETEAYAADTDEEIQNDKVWAMLLTGDLEADKKAMIEEINTAHMVFKEFKVEYRTEQWQELEKIFTDAIVAVNAAVDSVALGDIESIKSMNNRADKIKTHAEMVAEEFDSATELIKERANEDSTFSYTQSAVQGETFNIQETIKILEIEIANEISAIEGMSELGITVIAEDITIDSVTQATAGIEGTKGKNGEFIFQVTLMKGGITSTTPIDGLIGVIIATPFYGNDFEENKALVNEAASSLLEIENVVSQLRLNTESLSKSYIIKLIFQQDILIRV